MTAPSTNPVLPNPNNVPAAPGGWGFINDPPRASVPEGTHGVDAHGNRTVTLADGSVSTESMGTGPQHGIPNGDFAVSPVPVMLGPLDCDDPDAQAKCIAAMQAEVAAKASAPAVTLAAPENDGTKETSDQSSAPTSSGDASNSSSPATAATDSHTLDTSPVGTVAVKTTAGTQIVAPGGEASAPVTSDSIHAARAPAGTVFIKTADGIAVSLWKDGEKLGNAIEQDVSKAVKWCEARWDEIHAHKA